MAGPLRGWKRPAGSEIFALDLGPLDRWTTAEMAKTWHFKGKPVEKWDFIGKTIGKP